MADKFSKETRSAIMSKIRHKNTGPELKLKNFLEERGFVYQANEFGKPDFIHYRKKTVIFIDGCFWHMCPNCFKMPSSNKIYWKKKLYGNLLRDKEVTLTYKNSGWRVIRVWEHELKNSFPEIL